MYIIQIPAGEFDTAITVVVAHCLFIINHQPQVFKWLFNGLQGCDVAMEHSNKHLGGYGFNKTHTHKQELIRKLSL